MYGCSSEWKVKKSPRAHWGQSPLGGKVRPPPTKNWWSVLSLQWSGRTSGHGQNHGRKLFLKEVGAGQAALYPGKDIESDPLSFQGLQVKSCLSLQETCRRRMGIWGLQRGREIFDQSRLACSQQPAVCRVSCASAEHHSVGKPRIPPLLPSCHLDCCWGRWAPGSKAVLPGTEATGHGHLWLLKCG